MMALGLQPGDEVLLPVHTYVATAEVIALLGLKPVFVDVYPDTFTIDISKIEITNKTKAIVPVHIYGQCADMEELLALSKKYNLFVIEDAAQAIGADYTFSDGTVAKAGTMGDIGCTSFFPSKNLGCFGDGGALMTNDYELAEKCRMIANHGQRVKYHHDVIGCNSRLDTIQAAVLRVKLKHLDTYSKNRNIVADFYDKAFNGNDLIQIPIRSKRSTHVFHQYTLILDEKTDRNKLQEKLRASEIPSMIYYPIPLHLQKGYSFDDFGVGSFLVTEKLSKIVLSLPIHTEMDKEQLVFITEEVKRNISLLVK